MSFLEGILSFRGHAAGRYLVGAPRWESEMLLLKPNCECCDRDLPPDSAQARICSFECTFCADCADGVLNGACPNCGGSFAPRPIRPAAALARFPASTERVLGAAAPCVEKRSAA